MRKTYQDILKRCFCTQLSALTRRENCMRKSEMASHLLMTERAYYDLERGKFCCSALTLVLYLIYLCPDTAAFLEKIRSKFEEEAILLLLEGNDNSK